MAEISGKLLRVKFKDKYLKCQLDATLNMVINSSEDDPCKPDGDTVEGVNEWVQRTVDSQDWNITVNARAFLDEVGTQLDQNDLLEMIVDGDLFGDAEFLSTPGQHNNPVDMVVDGPVVITDFSLEAPASGKANYDLTLSGNGKPTATRIPATT